MGVNKTYLKENEGAIVSYSWVELAAGVGYADFYGIKDGTNYYLITNTPPVKGQDYGYTEGDATPAFETSTFNLPRYIKGNIYLTIPLYAYRVASSSYERISGATLVIVHADTSTTELTAPITYVDGPTSDAASEIFCDNKFKVLGYVSGAQLVKGDKLRLSFTASTPGTNTQCGFCHCPGNVTQLLPDGLSEITNTQMVLSVPFKIDT